jgi:hypothetical protein
MWRRNGNGGESRSEKRRRRGHRRESGGEEMAKAEAKAWQLKAAAGVKSRQYLAS